MQKFTTIHNRALKRKGGEAGLAALLPEVKTPEQITTIPDDRFLSEMSRCVFQAGFVWKVVNDKWDGFEKAFFGFQPQKLVMLSPEQLEELAKNPEIIRNMQKITSVQRNAQFVLEQAQDHGSFGGLVANWPSDDLIGLYKLLKQKGSRLGGLTGPRALRNVGVDTFLWSNDVVQCLQQAGVAINDSPSSQRDMTQMQAAFNTWHQESGLPYSHLSRICACSVGENHPPV